MFMDGMCIKRGQIELTSLHLDLAPSPVLVPYSFYEKSKVHVEARGQERLLQAMLSNWMVLHDISLKSFFLTSAGHCSWVIVVGSFEVLYLQYNTIVVVVIHNGLTISFDDVLPPVFKTSFKTPFYDLRHSCRRHVRDFYYLQRNSMFIILF